jgi:hypothetical protein
MKTIHRADYRRLAHLFPSQHLYLICAMMTILPWARGETNALRDIGMPGSHHGYVVPLNQSARLAFAAILEPEKAPAIDPKGIRIEQNHWPEVGLTVKLTDVNRTSTPVTFPVWQVDGRSLPEDVRKSLVYTKVDGRQVKWGSDGVGLIRGVPGLTGEEGIGALDAEAFQKKWGGMVFQLPASPGQWSAHELPLMRGEGRRTEHVLSFVLEIATPAQHDDKMGKEVELTVQAQQIGWLIRAQYDNLPRGFIVKGPWAKTAAPIPTPTPARPTAEITVGMSREEVVKRLGQPKMSMRAGGGETLTYEGREIELRDGKVSAVNNRK